jgi:hypothetical protein
MPTMGAPCSGPDGTTCIYGDTCNPITFVCMGGAWKDETTGSSPGIVCPPALPQTGDGCAQCMSAGLPPNPYTCSYDTSCSADGGASAVATCSGGRWLVAVSCGDGGSADAMAEAGADAGARD